MADFLNGEVKGLAAFFENAPTVPALSFYSGTPPSIISLTWADGSVGNTATIESQFRVKYLCEGQCSGIYRIRTDDGSFTFRHGQERTLNFREGDRIRSIQISKQEPTDQYRAVFDWYYEDDLIDRLFVEVATTDLNRPPGGVFDPSRFARLLADEPEVSDRTFSRIVPLSAEPPLPTPKQDLIYFQAADVTDRDGAVLSFSESGVDFIHPTNGRLCRSGVVADMAVVSNDVDLSPNEMTITLNGLQAELETLTRYDDYQYAEFKLWMFALNQRAQALEGEWLRYRGSISHAEFKQDEGNKTVSVTFYLITRISDPDKQLIPRISPAYQKAIDAGDTAFDKLVEQSRIALTWGRGEIRGYPESEKNY